MNDNIQTAKLILLTILGFGLVALLILHIGNAYFGQ